MARVLLSCLVVLLAACREPTQITVQLFSDLPCNVLQKSGVSLSASSPDRSEASPPLVVSRECSTDGKNNSVGTLVLVPSGEPDALVGIRAVAGVGKPAEECAGPGYEGCVVARREVRFQENESLVVRIELRAECEGNPCDPRSTCVAGKECRGIEIPEGKCEGGGCGEGELPPASGGAAGAGGKGGAGGEAGKGGGAGGMSGSSGQGGAGVGGAVAGGGQAGSGGAGQGGAGQGGAGQGGAGQGGAGQGGLAGAGAGGAGVGGDAGAGGEGGAGQGGAGQAGQGGAGESGAGQGGAGDGGAGQGGAGDGGAGQGGAGEGGAGAGGAGSGGAGEAGAGAGGEPGGQGGAEQGGAGQGGAGEGGAGGVVLAGQGGAGGCVPKTCEQLDKNCGTVDDGCGNVLLCQSYLCSSVQGSCASDGCADDGLISCSGSNVCGCTPGEYSCLEDVLFRCNEEGVSFTLQAFCVAGGCAAGAGMCTGYVAGNPYCDGSQLHKQDSNVEKCAGDRRYCGALQDACLVCLPNLLYCSGSELRQCGADGLSFSFVQDCGDTTRCHLGAKLGKCPSGP